MEVHGNNQRDTELAAHVGFLRDHVSAGSAEAAIDVFVSQHRPVSVSDC